MTACAAAPPAARVVVTPGVDKDEGAFEVTVRLPATVRRGSTVEAYVMIRGRDDILLYEKSAIDFSIAGRGIRNARTTPIGGEVSTSGFLGEDGTVLARGRSGFGPRSRLGFTLRFDVAPDAAMSTLGFQVHASVWHPLESRSFIRNYEADVTP